MSVAVACGPQIEAPGDGAGNAAEPIPDGAARDDLAADAEALAAGAFERFYDRTKLGLRAYLAAATHDCSLADDLTQEAFLRLYSSKTAFAGDDHRRRYLFRIASNLLTDHWRSARHATLPLDEMRLANSDADRPGSRVPDLDARRDLARALAGLAPRERQLVWLAHVEQLSHQEIAAVLAVGAASVRVLLFRARQRLALALRAEPTKRSDPGGAG